LINNNFFSILSFAVLAGFLALTGFNALQEGKRTREYIHNHELPALGMAVTANLDRTAAHYHRVGEELLRDGFLRDWILGGEQDEQKLRAFLENVRSRFEMMDASIVSDVTETYYGTDGRTLVLDPDNHERDGWYYLYRDNLVSTNIDTWYYPETGRIGIWINVPVLDRDGNFLGVTGGGIESEEFRETLHTYGRLPGLRVYLARQDGQLVYATDQTLLSSQTKLNEIWDLPVTKEIKAGDGKYRNVVLEPEGYTGPILWAGFSENWNTYLVLEKTGESVSARTRATILRSLSAGGFLTVSLYIITFSIIHTARKKIEEQTRRLEILAGKDPLTGLDNRLRFSERIERELARIRRTGEESCLLILDLDNFKTINDTYGHPNGDIVLCTVANAILTHLRETDFVARFGGEEFTVLLPGTAIDGAYTVADKIRLAIQECSFPEITAELRVTTSIGVAPLNTDRSSSLELAYQDADRALYSAKNKGRNRIEVAV
jgi:diguanylate cyclase (GGDEF)-like protein